MHTVRRKNLRDLISSQGDGSVASFARASGLTEARLSQLLSRSFRGGQNFGEKMARKIEAQCGLPLLALDQVPTDLESLTKEGGLPPMRDFMKPPRESDDPSFRDMVANTIPTTRDIHIVELAPKPNGPGFDTVKLKYANGGYEKMGVRSRWLRDTSFDLDRLFAIKVRDDSMSPNLFEGDHVVVNFDDITPSDGAVFVIGYEGDIIIRRLSRDAGQWWITADSPDQRRFAKKIYHDDGIQLMGRVVLRETEWI